MPLVNQQSLNLNNFLIWASAMESAMADSSANLSNPYIVICYNKAITYYSAYSKYLEADMLTQLIYNATLHYIITDYAPSAEELDDTNDDIKFKQMLAIKYKVTKEPFFPTASTGDVSSSTVMKVSDSMGTMTSNLLETKYGQVVVSITQHLDHLPIGLK